MSFTDKPDISRRKFLASGASLALTGLNAQVAAAQTPEQMQQLAEAELILVKKLQEDIGPIAQQLADGKNFNALDKQDIDAMIKKVTSDFNTLNPLAAELKKAGKKLCNSSFPERRFSYCY